MAVLGFEADLVRTLVSTATKESHRFIMEKCCPSDNDSIFDWILIKLAGNEESHEISDKFDFGTISTIGMRIVRL